MLSSNIKCIILKLLYSWLTWIQMNNDGDDKDDESVHLLGIFYVPAFC